MLMRSITIRCRSVCPVIHVTSALSILVCLATRVTLQRFFFSEKGGTVKRTLIHRLLADASHEAMQTLRLALRLDCGTHVVRYPSR